MASETLIHDAVTMDLSSSEDEGNLPLSDEDQNQDIVDAEEVSELGNPAWADCIASVLKSDKPKTKKSLVLSKAKKLNQIKKENKSYDFDIEGEIKEKPNTEELEKNIEIKKKRHELIIKSIKLRTKPSIADKERERALKKIAVRGVVQLFNVVLKQQKEIDKELQKAGPLDHRKDAVLNNINKRTFLDVLMGGDRAKSENIDNPVKKEIKEDSIDTSKEFEWTVLRDDFMTNKKLKHWDQESDNSDNENTKSNNDESGDSD